MQPAWRGSFCHEDLHSTAGQLLAAKVPHSCWTSRPEQSTAASPFSMGLKPSLSNNQDMLAARTAKAAAPRLLSDLDAFDQDRPGRRMVKSPSYDFPFPSMSPEDAMLASTCDAEGSPSFAAASPGSNSCYAAPLDNAIDGSLINQLLLHQAADKRSSSSSASHSDSLKAHASPPGLKARIAAGSHGPHSNTSAAQQYNQQCNQQYTQAQQYHRQQQLFHSHPRACELVMDECACTPKAAGDWRLGTDVQAEPPAAAAAAAACEEALPAGVAQLLAAFPASQHSMIIESLMASSHPQELLLAMQGQCSSQVLPWSVQPNPSAAMAQADLEGPVGMQWLQHATMTAAATSSSTASSPGHGLADFLLQQPSTPTASSQQGTDGFAAAGTSYVQQQVLQQLQLQAALAAQQAVAGSLPAAGAGSYNHMLHMLQQQQPAGTEQLLFQGLQQQHMMQQNAALAMAAFAGCPTPAAGMGQPHSMPAALGGYNQLQQQLLNTSNSPAASGLWSLAAAGMPATPIAASNVLAAAALAQQQQQQQHRASSLMQAAFAAGHQSSLMAAAAAAATYNQQLSAQLSSRLAAASCPSSVGQMPNNMAAFGMGHAGQQHSTPSGFAAAGSVGLKGRRSRSGTGSRISSGSGYAAGVDGYALMQHGSRAASLAGSDMGASDGTSAAAAAAAAVGVLAPELYQATFEEFWGPEGGAAAASAGSCGSEMSDWLPGGSSSTMTSGGSAGSCPPTSSSRAGSAAHIWQLDDEVEGAEPAAAATRCDSSDLLEHVCTVFAGAGDAVKGACRDQDVARNAAVVGATAKAAAASADTAAPAAAGKESGVAGGSGVAGCPVWFPGEREASGDDSWYLPLPPTCRLFVGNIGCWVDEALLLSYFGKYGNVVDVQVMWNTKMLARGRRVNREFAFISYSSPLEAARAVHWLDGCRLADVEKDRNGITVEYENGEGEATTTSGSVAAR